MFSKPNYGWTEVSFDGIKMGSASYIAGAIIPTLVHCYEYLANKGTAFNLSFDQEGSAFGIVQVDVDFYYWTDDTDSGHAELKHLFNDALADEYSFVKRIAKEAIEDVKTNWDEWVDFEGLLDECSTEEDKQEVENEIQEWIEKVESVMDVRQMELGNLLFGNSRGEYPIPREEYQDLFVDFLDKCGFDEYGHLDDKELEEKYGQIKESTLTNRDVYGEDCKNEDIKNNLDLHTHVHYFDNGVFMVNPYYWGDADDLAEMPNFVYYPENIEIQWYKYPLRDAYSNTKLTVEKLKEIIEKCTESFQG